MKKRIANIIARLADDRVFEVRVSSNHKLVAFENSYDSHYYADLTQDEVRQLARELLVLSDGMVRS